MVREVEEAVEETMVGLNWEIEPNEGSIGESGDQNIGNQTSRMGDNKFRENGQNQPHNPVGNRPQNLVRSGQARHPNGNHVRLCRYCLALGFRRYQ